MRAIASRAARTIAGALAVLVLVAVATYVAGEQTEVVVLRTFDADGHPHETKMWVVDDAGTTWVRVANPGRAWYRRLSADPHVALIRAGVDRPCIARPFDRAEVRERIDGLFRARYGIVDWWYGVLLRRHAIPIRLDGVPQSGSSGPVRSGTDP